MNRPIEDLLRQAYQAKVEPITEQRLSQLSEARAHAFAAELANDTLETGSITRLDTGVMPVLTHRRAHSRWFAPLLAAAAVVVVAAGAIAIATSHGNGTPQPAPPASHVSLPAPSSTPSSSPAPSGASSAPLSTVGGTGAPASYLGRGKTGARADVPWAAVGTGWRLIQLSSGAASSIYLYDPADGRYLITDQVSVRSLVGWSPDGARAMLQQPDGAGLIQLDLHSGQLISFPVPRQANFVGYTKPHGLAVLVTTYSATDEPVLQRYGLDGSLQLTYSNKINGIGVLNGAVWYVPDGSAFLTHGASRAFLLGNDGAPLRAYNPPAGTTSCQPLRLWDQNSFLEGCSVTTSRRALYLQPLDGSAPTSVINRAGYDYEGAWPLNNHDVLLQLGYGQCVTGYQILHPDGSTSALQLPAGVPAPGNIINVSRDLATFLIGSGCEAPQQNPHLLDYDMATGQTLALSSNGGGHVVNYPGDN